MKYTEITVYTNKNGIELLSAALMQIGICDIAVNDPDDIEELLQKKNSYDWDYVDASVLELKKCEPSVTIYAEEEAKETLSAVKKIVASLRASHDDLGRLECKAKVVDDTDWKDNWKKYFKPSRITERITVKPTWEVYERQTDDELVIEIDPGMAFGTGTHETTSSCVRLMEKYLKLGDAVLDVGSGSGILSIAAHLLGAGKVIGIDIDPEAVRVGRENVALNGFADTIEIVQGDLTKGVSFCADLVVANLMADLIKFLSKDVSKHIRPGGVYISSGILAELADDVADVIRAQGFEIAEILFDGEWCAIAAVNK